MALPEMITDRTQADFLRWQSLRNKGFAAMTDAEKSEWLAGMKGAYKNTDLNRVGVALNYLRARIIDAAYPIMAFTAKTDWTNTDILTAADLGAYLEYVAAVRGAIAQWRTTPPVPEYSGGLTIQEANDIEQIALDIEEIINKMLAARFFCGDLYSGEVG